MSRFQTGLKDRVILMFKRILLSALCVISVPTIGKCQMVPGDSIGNDPAKEKLCAARVNLGKVKTVPFEIDLDYVKLVRAHAPDATFIAVEGTVVHVVQLVECELRQGTGRYEPASLTPEGKHWHLIRPQQVTPSIRTLAGQESAGNLCRDKAVAKIDRPNFVHSVYYPSEIAEVNIGYPRYHPGVVIAGRTAERYDIVVTGTAFYKSSGPDLAAVKFTCLFSPTLSVKAISIKPSEVK